MRRCARRWSFGAKPMPDFAYDEFFIVSDAVEPAPMPMPTPVDSMARLKQTVRDVVREELRLDRDRKSFAAASGMLSLTELCEFLGKGRNTVFECRRQRDRAKTVEAKSRAFPPEYGDGRSPRWKRSEVEAWVSSQKRGA